MYAAVNAKIKAMRGRFLTQADYEALCRMKTPAIQASWLQERLGCKDEFCQSRALERDCSRLTKYIFRKPLRDFVKTFAEGLALGAVDVPYYLALRHRLGALDKQSAMLGIVGMEIDLRNILWIYRLKRYHNVSGDSVYGHLVPVSYRLNKDSVARMVNSKDLAGFMSEVSACVYGDVLGDAFSEQKIAGVIRGRYQAESRKSPNSLAGICGHLYERHLEVRNIAAVMEGVRLGLASEEIIAGLY